MCRYRPAALALAAGAVLLQACAASQPMGDESGAVVAPTAAAFAAPPTLASPQAGSPAVLRTSGEAPFVAAAATMASVPRALPAMRSPRAARDLTGLTDGQLLSVMGEPDLKRSEDGAEAWLYRSPACLLDVFLEADRPGDEPRVVFAAARPLGAAQVAEEACLRGLARIRAGLRQPFQP